MKTGYVIVKETPTEVVLRDVGPWTHFKTITNAAEDVVSELANRINGKKLFYYDSEGEYGELVHKDGQFIRFA